MGLPNWLQYEMAICSMVSILALKFDVWVYLSIIFLTLKTRKINAH